ncbi:MAG: MFS transporter [Pseudonocardia sediminis]
MTLGALATGSFATGTDSFVIAGVLPAVAADLGASVGAVGVTVALFAVSYAVGGPLLVAAAAGLRPRRVLIGAMTLFVLANLAAAAAPVVTALGAARIVAALGAGVFVPGAIAAAAQIGGAERRGRATAVVVGGASLALVLGAPLGTLAAQATSWRGSFVLVALIGLVAVAGVAALVTDPPPAPAPAWRDRVAVLRRPAVLAVLGVTLLANTAAFAVYPYLGVLFPDAGPSGVALLVFGFGAGAVAGTWLGGRAADAFGATRTVAVVVAVFALAHAGLGLVAGSLVLGVVYAVVWGLSGWATVPAQQSRLIGMSGESAPLALSLNSSAIHLGTGVGALAGAALVSGPGAGVIWLFAGLVSLAALALVPVGRVPSRRAAASGGTPC